MAQCTKRSTTYKQEFDLGGEIIVKVGLTLPFTLPEGRVGLILDDLMEAIDAARRESVPSQSRLFEREPATAGHGARP